MSPTECLRYVLRQTGVHVAICGAGTRGQMEDNIRTAQSLRKMTAEEIDDVRKRALVGAGVQTGLALEYWNEEYDGKSMTAFRVPGLVPGNGLRCSIQ
jgi:hypothetical protein